MEQEPDGCGRGGAGAQLTGTGLSARGAGVSMLAMPPVRDALRWATARGMPQQIPFDPRVRETGNPWIMFDIGL